MQNESEAMTPRSLPAIIICLLVAGTAFAQQNASSQLSGFSIGVRPQLIDLTGPAGSRRSFDLYVRNFDTQRSTRVWLSAVDALQMPTGALKFGEDGAYEYSAASWLKLDKDELVIRPGREERVRVTLTVPGNAKGSGHAVISVSGAPPKNVPIAPTRENQAYVVTRVSFGVILHYSIPGSAVPGAEIEKMYLTPAPPPNSGLTEKTSPYKQWLVARVRNTGNVMIYGYGWALLRRVNLGLVERWRLGEREYGSRKVIYPGRYIDMYMPVSRPLPSGDYIAQMRLDYAKSRAATAEVPITVKADQAGVAVESQSGPFATQTIGLAVTVDKELETLSVTPGGCRTGTIKVTNNEAFPLVIDASMQDVTMGGDGVLIPDDPASAQRAAGAWLTIAPNQFALPPGKSRRLSYVVTPAYDLTNVDDLVGLINLRAHQLNAVARQAHGEVIGETGVLMIASLGGRAVKKAELGVMQVDVRPELPGVVRVGVPVRNTGNVHFMPIVNLQLAGQDNPTFMLEKTLGKKTGQVLILPGRERTIWFELPRTQFQPGRYTATLTLDYGGSTIERRAFSVNLHDPDASGPDASPDAPDDTPDAQGTDKSREPAQSAVG